MIKKTIYVTGKYNDISSYKKLTFLYKHVSQEQYSDEAISVIANADNPDNIIGSLGSSSASSGEAYFPISAPVSQITQDENGNFKLAITLSYYDELENPCPTDYYIDKISVTNTEYAYKYMNGTSMASPACCGMVAVLAANLDESADKIAARIKGGTNHKSWLAEKCYTGGIVDLGRSQGAEAELDPVVINAKAVSSTDSSTTVKLSGYFLGGNNSSVTINNISASSVVVGQEGNMQTLTCTFNSKITGGCAINVNKDGKSLTKYLDIGNSSEVLERINLPDPSNPDSEEFYSATITELNYASNNYLYTTAKGNTFVGYAYDLNSQNWSKIDYINKMTEAFNEQGFQVTSVKYICADNDVIVYGCYYQDATTFKTLGFGYYNLNDNTISLDVLDSKEIYPITGYLDGNTMYLGCTSILDEKNYFYTYELNSKQFNKISDVVNWGKNPITYKIDDSNFLLIDIGSELPRLFNFTNDMYLLSINQEQNGGAATFTKLDQEAFPTQVIDQTQNKMTGHAVVNGMLVMVGPANTDDVTKGVVADTFVRNIQTKEEVALPGILSSNIVSSPFSASSDDYVYTYFLDEGKQAIAKRYVGSPVPPKPDPDPTPQDEGIDPSSSAATGDSALPVLFAIIAIVVSGGLVMKSCSKKKFI